MRHSIIAVSALLVAGGALAATSETIGKVQDWMFLPNDIKPATYRQMSELFATRTVKRGSTVYPLPPASGPTLVVSYKGEGWKIYGIDEFMSRNYTIGLLVLKNEKVVLDKYGWGDTNQSRWLHQPEVELECRDLSNWPKPGGLNKRIPFLEAVAGALH